MKWHAESASASTATGWRGVYTVTYTGFVFMLTGTGWDGLPMLALPPFGQAFTEAQEAAVYAAKVDSVRHLEPEVSGG